ncbi:MAG: hypothetical protein CL608_30405 [Anaerolineaceae bacterium]|nr:hypothetical protein [Anaerolineaceae bacterium]
MSSLLEITGEDIALLGDADLRSLIGRLCEADFQLAGLPTNGIIWGGHQDASDDGMDVTVHCDFEPPHNSRVPRKATGFQVKIPDMQPAKIGKEMKPKGELREEIKALIVERGAYIIVNSKGSVTEKALRMRLEAMSEAVASEPNYQQLHLDFLDRDRIATWVRTHPSLILWVRNKIGRPLQGWQPYDNWANTPTGPQEEFIVDEELRLHDGINSEQGDSVIDGLRKLRLRLSQNDVSIRLTGLSGVGKTRLVQALFDERVGDHALNQFLAYYTDISDNPLPDPPTFASQLIATDEKAVLIIDNCSLELHRKLTKLCAGSMVNLLTVEYDIRDDIPEETGVFRLEPSSGKVIEKLLEQRYPSISQINARTIAEFASGNARVAIALANTLGQDESLSTLRDEELFDRLFHQRHHPNENLKVSAEICSLVYSFDGVDSAETSELVFLANLAEKSLRELYRDVAELRNRGLVQARSVWRAVLPHAIANRLAKDALNSIPTQTVVDAFLSSGLERLIGSFTRRLSYLHDCEPVTEIAKEWLRPDGWIGATNCNFNTLGRTVFENIAPIAPEAALAMLERSSNEREGFERLRRHEFIRLLRHLAYEPDLFQRSARLLSKIALLEQPNTNDGGSARRTLSTLFHIFLSGTHAPAQIRVTIIDELLNSSNEAEQELGISLLEATLKTHHFMTNQTNTFGARPRDFGYRPETNQEVVTWYRIFLAICTQTAMLDAPISKKVKRVMANHLRGLWSIGVRFDQEFLGDLEQTVIQIHSDEAWNEGWISVKGIIRHDGERMEQKTLSRLKQLSQRIKPINLLERARAYALTDGRLNFHLEEDFHEEEDFSNQWKRVRDITRQIGVEVAQDEAVFRELLPDLVSNYHDRLGVFGEGLAEGCEDKKSMWQSLYKQFAETIPEKRQIAVMLGFLSSCAIHDPALYNLTLDSLIEDELLGQWFPYFQMTSEIDKQGIERLHKALVEGKIDIYSFGRLAWGRRHEAIDDDDLATLVQKLISIEGGARVAVEILSMRFHKEKGKSNTHSQQLISVSREVLLQFTHEEKQNRGDPPDHRLAQIAEVSLQGEEGTQSAAKLCQRLAEEFQEYRIYSFHYPRLLTKLAQVHPYIFLDSFIGCDEYMFRRGTFGDLERADSPVNQIPENIVVDWCEEDPAVRYPLIVSSLQTYSKTKDSEELYWEPIVFSIFEKSPNIKAVLSQLESEIYPMSWSGSRAEAMAKRLPLLEKLFKHSTSVVQEWAIEQHQRLQIEVENQRASELKENQERFERFE